MKQYCRTCKLVTKWNESTALVNTPYVFADFPGDYSGTDISKAQRGQTVCDCGPAKIKTVLKCSRCGRSVSLKRDSKD